MAGFPSAAERLKNPRDRRYLHGIREQLSHGGIVLWVVVHNAEQEKRAARILGRCHAHELHAHELPLVIKPIPGWRGISCDLSFMKRLDM